MYAKELIVVGGDRGEGIKVSAKFFGPLGKETKNLLQDISFEAHEEVIVPIFSPSSDVLLRIGYVNYPGTKIIIRGFVKLLGISIPLQVAEWKDYEVNTRFVI